MSQKTSITLFTPTYNRGCFLTRLYESLVRQTHTPCEWVVVDDGSNDDTALIMEELIARKELNIIYKYQKNGGKHRAINQGVLLATGSLFFIVDSDDYLPEDSLEIVARYWQSIPEDRQKDYAGVSGLRFCHGQVVGDYFPCEEYVDMTYWELRQKHKIAGDKAEVYLTSILLQYPFPEFEGENFLTEAVVWGRIAQAGYPLRWFNQNIYSCEYQKDGLSDRLQQIIRFNPQGSACYYNQEQLYPVGFRYALAKNYNYYFFSMLAGKTLASAFSEDNKKSLAVLGIALAIVKRIFKP